MLSFQGQVQECDCSTLHSQSLTSWERMCMLARCYWLLYWRFMEAGNIFQTFQCIGLLLLLLILLQSSACFNAMHAALTSILRVDNLWGQLKQSIQVWEEPLIHSNSSHWIINNSTDQKQGVKGGDLPLRITSFSWCFHCGDTQGNPVFLKY